MSTNNLTKKVGIGVLSLVLFMGLTPVTFARTEVKTDPKAIFCNNFDNVATKIDERISTRETNFHSHKDTRKTKVDTRMSERKVTLEKNRTTHDSNRETRYSKLDVKADTTTEKQAVADFKVAIEQAVVIRKSAVDTAINTFNSGLSARMTQAESEANNAIDTYKSAVDTALAKAKTSCASGADGTTVRTTLREDIKTAREALRTTRLEISNDTKTELTKLRDARKLAVETAVNAFKSTLKTETAKLKEAFAKKGMVPLSSDTTQ